MEDLTYSISAINSIGHYRIFKLMPKDKALEYKAGHFVMLNNGQIGRPYSIASAPSWPYLEFVIHLIGGQFTSYLEKVKVGDELKVKGPAGHFTYNDEERLILIGGGAGIAPLMSITRHVIEEKKAKVDLFYSSRYLHEAPYLSELMSYAKAGLINLHFTVTREEIGGFRHGRFSPEDILKLGDISDATVFLCGNMAMAKAFKESLEGKVADFKVEAWG